MAGPHENLEHAEHAQHAAHGGENNKKIALIISVLALCLAFSETFGKSAQTAALNAQIEASNLWNFFQAKNIRRTMTIVATEMAKIDAVAAGTDQHKAALAKQIDAAPAIVPGAELLCDQLAVRGDDVQLRSEDSLKVGALEKPELGEANLVDRQDRVVCQVI